MNLRISAGRPLPAQQRRKQALEAPSPCDVPCHLALG